MLSPADEIKNKLDIVDVIGEYIPLKQSGASFKACCPFHNEKTPSFMVNREKQFFYCFGCQASGDIFSFLQRQENIEFPEALRILANKAGVELPNFNPQEENIKSKLIDMNELASDVFHYCLMEADDGKRALEYLREKRGLSDKVIKDWKLGYAPDSWDFLWKYFEKKGFKKNEMLESGLVSQKQDGNKVYDKFRARVMFPIRNFHGVVVGFTGRSLRKDEPAKYMNSPQTKIYDKSSIVFGLDKAKKSIKKEDKVVVVEGNMDVIASAQVGVENVVALSGTAMTSEQVKLIKRLTDNFVFALDSDEAGVKAVKRSIEVAWQAEVNVRVAPVDGSVAKDPDELIKKDVDLWKKLIAGAPMAMDYILDLYEKSFDTKTVEGKNKIVKHVAQFISQIANVIEKDVYIKKLAELIGVTEEAIRSKVSSVSDSNKRQYNNVVEEGLQTDIGNKHTQEGKMLEAGKRLIAYCFLHADYASYILDRVVTNIFHNDLQNLYNLVAVYYTKEYSGEADFSYLDVIKYLEKESVEKGDIIKELEMIFVDSIKDLSYHDAMNDIKLILGLLYDDYSQKRRKTIERQVKDLEDLRNKTNDKNEVDKLDKDINDLVEKMNEELIYIKTKKIDL